MSLSGLHCQVNTFLTKQIQLSYLPCIKVVGVPVSVSSPVERNVNDQECLPLVSVLKGCTTLSFKSKMGDRNSSVGSVWARCQQRRGFDPPLGTFSGRGDFSLGVNMGSNSIPPKILSDESIN